MSKYKDDYNTGRLIPPAAVLNFPDTEDGSQTHSQKESLPRQSVLSDPSCHEAIVHEDNGQAGLQYIPFPVSSPGLIQNHQGEKQKLSPHGLHDNWHLVPDKASRSGKSPCQGQPNKTGSRYVLHDGLFLFLLSSIQPPLYINKGH